MIAADIFDLTTRAESLSAAHATLMKSELGAFLALERAPGARRDGRCI